MFPWSLLWPNESDCERLTQAVYIYQSPFNILTFYQQEIQYPYSCGYVFIAVTYPKKLKSGV